MMTLLNIAQEILKETKSATIPQSIVGNSEDSAVQVLEALRISITNLARSYDWQELTKEHTFNAVASTEAYSLPSDFDRIVNDTFWNSTDNRQLIGSTIASEWRILKNSTISGGAVDEYYRIRQNNILIFPTPTTTDGYVFEYITNLIINSSGGSGQTDWLADTDVPNIDDYVLRLDATWRLLNMQGRPYAEKQREADLATAERVSINGGNQTIYHRPPNRFDKSRIGYPTIVTSP